MRLLDPLNGMKFSQMHFFVHIAFFVAMFFVDKNIYDDTKGKGTVQHNQGNGGHDDKKVADDHHSLMELYTDSPIQDMELEELRHEVIEKKALLKRLQARNYEKERESRFKTQWDVLQHLSGHGAAAGGHGAAHQEDEMTKEEEHQEELFIFNALQWTHLAIFLNQMFIAAIKKRGYHDQAQTLAALQLAFAQMPFFYNIYFCKNKLDHWEANNWNEIRIFLFLEIIWFFEWIFIGILYLAFAYLIKFQVITKEESVGEADDNPWNDKFSDDFMRYEKAEMYNFSQTATKFFFDIQLAFFNYYNIGAIGPRDMYPTKTLFGILAFDRLALTMLFVISLINSWHITTNNFKKYYRIYLVIHVIVVTTVVSIYFTSDLLKDQSLICQIWLRFILVDFVFDGMSHLNIMYSIGMCNCGKARTEEEALELYTKSNTLRSESDMDISSVKKDKMIAEMKKKDHLDFENDFTTMTVFSFLKKNQDKYWITPAKRAQMFHQALAIQANTLAMLVIVFYAIWTNEGGRYTVNYAKNFPTFYVKIACVLALHFVLYPEVSKGLNIMKIANQHPSLFVEDGGAKISYILGLSQVMLALICEGLNLFMLTFQSTISHCIIHFVAFKVIVDLSNMYFKSLMNNKLKSIVNSPPHFDDKQTGPNKVPRLWSDRTCFHKIARILYKIIRCGFVSVNYYFAPYVVIYWQFIVKVDPNAAPPPAHH